MMTGPRHLTLHGQSSQIDTVKWSNDNHIALLTDTSIHIIQPQLTGISSKKDSFFIKSTIWASFENRKEVESYKRIRSDNTTLRISDLVRDSFKQVCWSPLHRPWNGGCQLAVLTTTHRVLIYEPPDLKRQSNWHVIQDITDDLFGLLDLPRKLSQKDMNSFEWTCLSWSSNCNYSEKGTRSSIFAVGSKGANLMLVNPDDLSKAIHIEVLSNSWITSMAFSPWLINEGHSMCILAVADALGQIHFCTIENHEDDNDFKIDTRKISYEPTHLGFVHSIQFMKYRDDKMNFLLAKGNVLEIVHDCTVNTLVTTQIALPDPTDIITAILYDDQKSEIRLYTITGRCFSVDYNKNGNTITDSYKDITDVMIKSLEGNRSRTNLIGKKKWVFSGISSSMNHRCDAICYRSYNPMDVNYVMQKQAQTEFGFHLVNHGTIFDSFASLTNDSEEHFSDVLMWETMESWRSSTSYEQEVEFLLKQMSDIASGSSTSNKYVQYRCMLYLCILFGRESPKKREKLRGFENFLRNEVIRCHLDRLLKSSGNSIKEARLMTIVHRQRWMRLRQTINSLPDNEDLMGKWNMIMGLFPEMEMDMSGLAEQCPVCNEEVPFTSLWSSSCKRGHSFNRCVVTFELLGHVHKGYTQCAVCESKMIRLPTNASEEEHPVGMRTNEQQPCPICGGRFGRRR